MAKYDEQFKLKAIQRYLAGVYSYREVAQSYGIDHSMLRRWVARYRLHGRQGIRSQHKRYAAQFKLEVLEHIRRDGLSDRQALALYNLRNPSLINQWRNRYDIGGIGALAPPNRARDVMPHSHPPGLPPEEMTEQQLREEVASLRAELDYLKKLDALIQTKRAKALAKKRK